MANLLCKMRSVGNGHHNEPIFETGVSENRDDDQDYWSDRRMPLYPKDPILALGKSTACPKRTVRYGKRSKNKKHSIIGGLELTVAGCHLNSSGFCEAIS